MKVNNNVQTPNFGAVLYTPTSKLYTSVYLTARDTGMLDRAAERLKNTKFWNLEVTGAGLRIAAKQTKDAFMDEFRINEPKTSDLVIEATYDGRSDTCKTGNRCYFKLHYPSKGYAMLAYEEFRKKPFIEKIVEMTERLEEQAMSGQDPTNYNSSIAEPRLIDKIKSFFS